MTTHSSARAGYIYVLIFILLTVSIIVTGYLYYHDFEQHFRVQAESQISAVAQLKVDELADWRKERLSDASILYQNPAFSSLVERYFKNPDDTESRTQLVKWLENYQVYDQYDGVRLLDTTSVDRLSIPDAAEKVDENLQGEVAASLRSREIAFLDFQHDASVGGDIRIFILIPIYAGSNNDRPLGVLALRIAPQYYLYPYIKSWPSLSTSAETLLVRRDGDAFS